MKLRKILLWIGGGILFIPLLYIFFFVFVVGPVDISKENSVKVSGTVERVLSDETTKDITIKLRGDDNTYYINRGLESEQISSNLESDLLGKSINLWYAKSWPLKGGHIVQVKESNAVVYTEWL